MADVFLMNGDSKSPELTELIESAPVVGGQPKESESRSEPEMVQQGAQAAESVVTSQAVAGEKPGDVPQETIYTPEQVEVWRRDSDNKKKWQGELTRKSQIIGKYTDDQIRSMMAMAELNERVKDQKLELPEFVELSGTDEYGDTIKTKISRDSIQGLFEQYEKQARQSWINEIAPQSEELAKMKSEVERQSQEAGLMVLQQYFKEVGIDFDFGDNPYETIDSVFTSGQTHPEYDKLDRARIVMDYAKRNDMRMNDAHVKLFGEYDQAKKARAQIIKAQNGMQPERPGKAQLARTDDEIFLDGFKKASSDMTGIF